jgi:lipopolysaccharide export system protein LptC
MRRDLPRRASRTIEVGGKCRPSGFIVRNTVVMILLAICAAAIWFAAWQRQEAPPAMERPENTEPLGYYILGARFSGTDEQGRVTYRVSADRLDELPGDQRLQLTGVKVDYQPTDEAAWAISADTATAARDLSQLDLLGSVEVRGAAANGSGPWTIRSDALYFWPQASKVESRTLVEAYVGDWKFDAVGLLMDLKGETLELESEVHGILLP